LAVNPHQRILFVLAYINSIVEESFAMQQLLKQETIQVLQKPVSPEVLIDTTEDRAIYSKLENLAWIWIVQTLRDILDRHMKRKSKKKPISR
jgi:hypothetical protein